MAIPGSDNFYSAQIGKQCQMTFGSCINKKTGFIDKQAFNAMANSSIYQDYKQARAMESHNKNMNNLVQTAYMYQQMGVNVDLNQLAAMCDKDGNGMINTSSEMQMAQRFLQMAASQQLNMNNMAGMQQNQGSAQGGGFDLGGTLNSIGSITDGIGQLIGKGGSGEEEGGGNFLSKAGDFIGKLFG